MAAPQLSDDQTKEILKSAKALFADLEQARRPHEQMWDQIREFIIPRRNFDLVLGAPSVRPRYLVDTTARTANERLAALLFGYMVPPHRPWLRPTIEGRDTTPSEQRWLDDVRKILFEQLQMASSGFLSATHESLQDDCAFGNSVIWIGRNGAGGRPVHKALPLSECYWRENADGVVDMLYRKFGMTLSVAVKLFKTPKLEKLLENDTGGSQIIEFLHIVELRDTGVSGIPGIRKALKSVEICLTTDEVVKISGFDSFPYSVTRFQKRAGESYGEGPGADALPLARLLNQMEESVLRAAELETDPPLVSMIGKIPKLDRRPGGLTNLSTAQLRRMEDPGQVLRRLYDSGNPATSIELARDFQQRIQFIYYIDWMSLQIGANPTATEINERRDIRLRSMAPAVARLQNEKLTSSADRHYFLLEQVNRFNVPPESIAAAIIIWEFVGPLAIAQQQSVVETFGAAMTIIERASVFDQDAPLIVKFDPLLRSTLEAVGLEVKDLATPDEVKRGREQKAAQRDQAAQLEAAEKVAGAAQSGGQAIASVSGVAA